MTTRRPANLVLPLSDAKLRLRHKTKIYGKPEGFSFTPKKRESIAEVRKVSVKDVLTFVSKGPEDENFESTAEFLNQVSRFLHGVVDKQDKDLNESVIQRRVWCFPFVVHDEPQIRAMAFRLIRFSVHRESQLQKLLLSQLDVMLVRSLDFSELEQEKEEAFKLICKLLFLYRDSALKKFIKEEDSNFTLFPKSVLKSIITIALDRLPRILDIVDERKPEKLFLPALGILVDLAVEDPELVLKCAGTEWIVRSVVVLGADNSNVSSLVCKVLLKWMDTADLREKARIGLVIEQIFSPLIDLGFFHQKIQDPKKGDPPQVKVSQILESVSTIFLSIIRSWTGILACGAIDETGELISSSPFKLLSFLGLGTAFNPTMLQIRDMVIGICCEFVDMPYASKKFSDWSEALVFYAKMHLPDKYKTSLRDDFVVGEIEALQTSGIMNPDIVDCLMSFRAVACYVLIEAGLPQALARLIMARPDDPMSIKATLLLADLLKSGATFLPEEKKLMLLSVPTVIQAASERTQMSAKTANGIFPTSPLTFPNSDNAMILIHRLDQLNDTGLNRLALESELIQIELFVKGGEFLFCKNDIRKRTWSTLDSDERFEKLITVEHDFFSRSTSKDLNLDNLESIVAHLEAENSIIMKKYRHNDRLHSFFSKIFTIIFPSNARFVTDTVTFTANIVKSLCRTVRLVVPLAKMEPHYGELIEKFLNQTKEQLDPEVLYKGIFSPKNILNNGSRYYFAILAAIGSLSIGIQMIEESGIYQM